MLPVVFVLLSMLGLFFEDVTNVVGWMSALLGCNSSSDEPARYRGPSSSLRSITGGGFMIPIGGRNEVPAGAIILAIATPFFLTPSAEMGDDVEVEGLAGEDAATWTIEGC